MAAESKDRPDGTGIATADKDEHSDSASSSGPESTDGHEHDTEGDDGEDEDADEEPKLKYTRLTGNLGPVYRGGDATSSFMVAGDKMIIGTHNGNIHIFAIPSFQSMRLYHAHSASVTAISVSPFPPPLPNTRGDVVSARPTEAPQTLSKAPSVSNGAAASPRTPKQPLIPATPSNSIYIATASIDGHVCVSSLVDPKDVTLRNFARPVQAVALSPEYKSDRTYLSGGLAGNLILTTGGRAGVSANANTNSAAAAASGWLGAIGLGSNAGRDTILHSGEGAISTIKWSFSGKFVVWANEQGIRIMRTNVRLESQDSESAWKRIGLVEKPNFRIWEEMAGVWKARAEWIDYQSLETEDDDNVPGLNGANGTEAESKSHKHHLKGKGLSRKKEVEKLVVGWGDAAWVIHVHPGGAGTGKHVGERSIGSAEIIHFLRFEDCIISGLSLYTPSLLLVLAYRTRDDNDNPISPVQTTPRRGVHHRQNGLPPELKLINAATGEEAEVDELTISRYETLSAADYHLSTLYIPHPTATPPAQRGAFEAIGGGIWDAGVSATRIFSSGASIISMAGSGDKVKSAPSQGLIPASDMSGASRKAPEPHPSASSAGLKIFIQSPYDCFLAVKRDLGDHLDWLLEHDDYEEAWDLVDSHPEIITPTAERVSDYTPTGTPVKTQGSLAEFFADETASETTISGARAHNSAVEKEKRRIGDLWVKQLVAAHDWATAGRVAGRVLGASPRWEHWVWAFAQAGHFDEITPYIPTKQLQPPLPSLVYEVVLGHYIIHDRLRFKELMDQWDPELFEINSVIEAIKSKLSAGDITEDTVEDGEQGRDWRILQDALAKLYVADGRYKDALRCYIRLQNADAAMSLIREHHLLETVRDDIPGFVLMRVSKEQVESAPLTEFEEASSEAIHLLVDEAYQGIVRPDDVVNQLQQKGIPLQPFLFFYLRELWKGQGTENQYGTANERIAAEGKTLAEDFSDLVVEMFAEYDRPLLMEFLRSSQNYSFDNATVICERRQYIPELVFLLSKTGQTKRALFLIIDKLCDVSQAISFAKEQDDPDLWNDLLDYSMDKPSFIRALLEEVGTSINPITLVRRIPEGLEIEGLRDGIGRMVREYEIQYSISEGVAKVLRGEVAASMDMLRAGQKRGVKFEVVHEDGPAVEVFVEPVEGTADSDGTQPAPASSQKKEEYKPGHCVGCKKMFVEDEPESLIGFACGHVFHLSCLLSFSDEDDNELSNSASAAAAARLQSQFASDGDEDGYTSRSVGAKVAHAHIIRSAIRGGCPVCSIAERS